MRRAVAAALAVCLLGALAWTVSSRERVEERAARLATDFDRSTEEAEQWRAALRTATRLLGEDLEAQRRETRRWRNRAWDLRLGLRDARRDLRGLADLADVLAPGRASVHSTEVLRSTGGTRLLVASWSGASRWEGTLKVWRLPPEATRGVEWKPVYEVAADGEALTVRTPTTFVRTPSNVGDAGAGLVVAHDLTGDGLRDLVIHAMGTGSGGCGTVWVLENADPLREIFERLDCENYVDARDGLLVYDDAREPKWCEYVHGCGRRTTWLRWDGATWETVKTRRHN